MRLKQKERLCNSQVYEVGAHVHWLWHFHASLYDAASDICMEEYHLCRRGQKNNNKNADLNLIQSENMFKSSDRIITVHIYLTDSPPRSFGVYSHTAVGQ